MEPPCVNRNCWYNHPQLVYGTNYRFSHTYRENNSVANLMASLDVFCHDFTWWTSPLIEIWRLFNKDANCFPKYRFHWLFNLLFACFFCRAFVPFYISNMHFLGKKSQYPCWMSLTFLFLFFLKKIIWSKIGRKHTWYSKRTRPESIR